MRNGFSIDGVLFYPMPSHTHVFPQKTKGLPLMAFKLQIFVVFMQNNNIFNGLESRTSLRSFSIVKYSSMELA